MHKFVICFESKTEPCYSLHYFYLCLFQNVAEVSKLWILLAKPVEWILTVCPCKGPQDRGSFGRWGSCVLFKKKKLVFHARESPSPQQAILSHLSYPTMWFQMYLTPVTNILQSILWSLLLFPVAFEIFSIVYKQSVLTSNSLCPNIPFPDWASLLWSRPLNKQELKMIVKNNCLLWSCKSSLSSLMCHSWIFSWVFFTYCISTAVHLDGTFLCATLS